MRKIIDSFYLELERLGRSPKTISGYKIDIGQFLKFSGKGLNTDTFGAAVHAFFVSGPKASPCTLKRRYAALKSLARYAKIRVDPIELPKILKRLPKSLRENEIEKLFHLLRKDKKSQRYLRDLAIFELLYCGLRNSELRRLTRESIDYYAQSLRVIGKGNKELVYNLSEAACVATKEYAKHLRGSLLFDLTSAGLIRIITVRSEKYIGKHVTPHTLRHSMAMHMLIAGTDIRLVQKMLNHSSISTTQVYTEAYDDVVATAFQSFHPHN